jgi:LPS export ABC transporter protein LptC
MLLLLAVGTVGIQLARNQWAQHLRRLRVADLEFLPEAAQRIQNFRRVKMEGDRKAWEIAAQEAQYFEDDRQIVVNQPEVSFYLKGDQGVVSLRGNQGTITIDGREMDRVVVEGGIEVRFKDYVVRTERAVYERAADSVVSPTAVSISGNGLELRGGRMTVELEAQRLHLDGKVETVLQQQVDGGGNTGAGTL